jgi:tetratricopeptide (TPR) repeat protein
MRLRPLLPLLLLTGLLMPLWTGCTSESDRLYRRAKDAANEEGDYETAIRFVDDAIRLNPDEGRYYRRRGDWLRELGRQEEALEAYDRAVSAANPTVSAINKAISLCLDMGRLDEAQERIDRAATVLQNPDDLENLDELRARLSQMRAEAAASAVALEASPEEP